MTFDPTRIYDVVHPAPMTYLARRARTPAHAWARMTTPVRLRHIDADMPKLAFVGEALGIGGFEYHAFEGALWSRITGARIGLFPILAEAPVMDGDRLAAYLSGHGGGRSADLEGAFCRTPVKARAQDFRVDLPAERQWTCGEDFSTHGVREILMDGREYSGERLQRYFASNVMVAGDALFVRSGDPVGLSAQGGRVERFVRSSSRSRMWAGHEPLALNGDGRVVCSGMIVEGARTLDHSAFDPLDHAVSLAHSLPDNCVAEAMRLVSNCRKYHLRHPGFETVRVRLNEFARDMAAMSREFATGEVSPQRAREAMILALSHWKGIAEIIDGGLGGFRLGESSWMRDTIECIRRRDLPLLDGALREVPDPEDEEAMNGLAV